MCREVVLHIHSVTASFVLKDGKQKTNTFACSKIAQILPGYAKSICTLITPALYTRKFAAVDYQCNPIMFITSVIRPQVLMKVVRHLRRA